MGLNKYYDRVYSGVLGKILGVYLGRPVEGWTYENIQKTFGEVYYYKNHITGAPLIVPDDDISGTFVFYRALADNGWDPNLSAEQIGEAWLNYIVEEKTILWWGGLSRSTEHTAFLRLKNGIKAPESGSIALNGRSMAEQIGSQIFIDTWALINPNNPDRAADMARKAASVSHDGIAIDAAVYLAAIEAMAFEEKNLDTLLDRGLAYISHPLLISLIADIREQCAKAKDWKEVRQWIADHHGYERYPGNCPMVTNHLVVLASLLLGGDDFQESIMIATSMGWDTDCNAGNVGCVNGIRLGLECYDQGTDLRKAVGDRMYVVSSDGGSCISDAVLETRKLLIDASELCGDDYQSPKTRYAFEFSGSTQGVIPYDYETEEQKLTGVEHARENYGLDGCALVYQGLGKGTHATACIDTFIDLNPKGKEGTSYFDVICSPTLYSGQDVTVTVQGIYEQNPDMILFIQHFNEVDGLEVKYSERFPLERGENTLTWTIPDLGGHSIYRLGLRLLSDRRADGAVIIRTIDWANAPRKYHLRKSMEMTPSLTPWTTSTAWLKTFVSSAQHFHPDYTTTFSICHNEDNGVVTTGTHDWDNYSIQSKITFSQQNAAGLVLRAKGHRQYYGAVFTEGKARIYRQTDGLRRVVAEVDYPYEIDSTYELTFASEGSTLSLYVDGALVLQGEDSTYARGGAGFVVDGGATLADEMTIERIGG
ncbi:MAG: ADP-ribosylglycohydrolase family protein [Tissierellia bacterium]|nr:ADP-ribosylglycohydrolase family protein [Tissierellia bacterium]